MERIIVGFDGSEPAVAALRWALREAKLRGAEVTAYTALAKATDPQLLAELRHLVKDTAGAEGCEHRVEHGGPAATLARLSADTDLLVVGSRGRSAIVGMVLGSVSRACLHSAQCPIAVVRAEAAAEQRSGQVIVGVDGSPSARTALRIAAREAVLRGADLIPVHAVHWDPLGAEWIEPTTHDLLTWGRRLLDRELADLGDEVVVRPRVVHGHAADVLVRNSRHADLLVVGSHGRAHPPCLTLGSVSNHCAAHAGCPVLVSPAADSGDRTRRPAATLPSGSAMTT